MQPKSGLHIYFAGIVLAGIFGLANVQAATIYLNPSFSEVGEGDTFTLELWMDFAGDATLGGGLDIVFDNFVDGDQLTFVSYVPEALGDPALISTPTIAAAKNALEGITFGDLIDGLEGPALVGTLTFTANIAGNYNLSLRDNVDAGGFYSATGLSPQQQFPLYAGAAIDVDAIQPPPPPPAGLPLPGTAWLMLAGMGGWAGARRKRAAA